MKFATKRKIRQMRKKIREFLLPVAKYLHKLTYRFYQYIELNEYRDRKYQKSVVVILKIGDRDEPNHSKVR